MGYKIMFLAKMLITVLKVNFSEKFEVLIEFTTTRCILTIGSTLDLEIC